MPTVTETLYEKTYKGDVETRRRVFYTLTDTKGLETTQTARAFSLLVELLQDKGIINEKEIDDLLLKIVS